MDHGALAEAKPPVRHGKPLLKDMVAHHYLGARGGHAVQVKRAGVRHELRAVVAERARRIAPDGKPAGECLHRPFHAPEDVDCR